MTNEQQITLFRFANMRTMLDQFEEKSLQVMLGSYEQAAKELVGEIGKLEGFAKERATAALMEAQGVIDTIQERIATDIADMSTEAGVFSYNRTNDIVSWDGKVEDFVPVNLSPAQINSLVRETPVGGVLLDEWVGRAFGDIRDDIKQEISTGYVKGEGYRKLVERLTGQFDMVGHEATTLARTYVQSVNVKAAEDIYAENKDIVSKVEWTAVLEGFNVSTGRGVCQYCQSMDGMTFDVGKNPPCPAHPRCKCLMIPTTKTWRELGFDIPEMRETYRPWNERIDRATGVGGVPIIDYGITDKNYADWWMTKSKTFQNNAMGNIRANLIRDKALDFSDIPDIGTGRIYTLKELVDNKSITQEQLDLARKH